MKRPHPFEWLLERRMRDEHAAVDEPQRLRSLWWRDAVFAVVALTAIVFRDLGPIPVQIVAGLIIGWAVGMSLMHRTRRAQSYKFGWLAGRLSYLRALEEASRRRIPIGEFLNAEMIRDFAVLSGKQDPTEEPGNPPSPPGKEDT